MLMLQLSACNDNSAIALAENQATPPADRVMENSCDSNPTEGLEPRHPYLGVEFAQQAAANPLLDYGHYPYVYTLYVPPGLNGQAAPLLVFLHGLFGSAANQAPKAMLEKLAEREGFILAYLSGARSWWPTEDGFDLNFVRDVVADIRTQRCVDPYRIWVSGHSNGGFMAQRVACDAGDIFAAAAIYAGNLVDSIPFGGPCRVNESDEPGVEVLPIGFWHGTADKIVAYETGRRALGDWVNRYRCDTIPIEIEAGAKFGPRERYGNCQRPDIQARESLTRQRFEIQFHTFLDHDHAYPDGCGGVNVQSCSEPNENFPLAQDLNREIYAFLSRHARAMPAAQQSPPTLPALPQLDLIAQADELADLAYWEGAPRGELVLVNEEGQPITAVHALKQAAILVELAVHAPASYPDASLDNHPECPSTTTGSRKVRILGRDISLRITDTDGATEYQSTTVMQSGTGLSVASFAVKPTAAGTVIIEATTGLDPVATPLLCTVREVRFQQTLQR